MGEPTRIGKIYRLTMLLILSVQSGLASRDCSLLSTIFNHIFLTYRTNIYTK